MLRTVALLSVVAACGGGSIAFSELGRELQRARCEHLARCGQFPDEASCLRLFRIVPDRSLAGAIAAHKVGYSGERARACADATAQLGCDLTAHDAHIAPAPCSEMFTGTLAGGESCSIDPECVSGRCVLPATCPPTGCCVGACRPAQPPGQPGDSCALPADCSDGLVCGEDLTCHVPAAAGGACRNDRECSDGLGCLGANPTSPGTCGALPHLGEPCPYLRCAELDLRCDDADTHSCVTVGLPGDPCVPATECASGFECDMAAHRCREIPTLGMPCDGVCGGEAFCSATGPSAGSCVAPLTNTSPCNGYLECASYYCEQGPLFDSCKDPYVCF